jgi:hypothetical protein
MPIRVVLYVVFIAAALPAIVALAGDPGVGDAALGDRCKL